MAVYQIFQPLELHQALAQINNKSAQIDDTAAQLNFANDNLAKSHGEIRSLNSQLQYCWEKGTQNFETVRPKVKNDQGANSEKSQQQGRNSEISQQQGRNQDPKTDKNNPTHLVLT
jgi:hypothetical protein